MEIAAGLIKLKPNTTDRVTTWRRTIESRRAEALATLEDEGVAIESWFQIDIDGEPHLLWYMRAESLERVWQVAQKSTHDIDAFHFQTMSEITAKQIQADAVLDLNT